MKVTAHLDLGKVAYTSKQKRNKVTLELNVATKDTPAPHRTIDLQPAQKIIEVSICGAIWNATGTDWAGGGQNQDTILQFFPTGNPSRIVELWERWHLNGTIGGTRPQRAFVAGYQLANPEWRYDYGEACKLLDQGGLLEDRGYKYGSAWLSEHVDPAALTELFQLFGFQSPEGDQLIKLATELHKLSMELTYVTPLV